MEEHYSEIKHKYDEFYKELLQKGRIPVKDTGLGFWGAAVTDEVFEIFKRINLSKFNHLLDIGSGDGKVVLIASLFGIKATGIEIDKGLFEKSLEIKKELSHIKHLKNTEFINKDFNEHNFSKHDIFFLNPDIPFYRGIENKLLSEMRGKLVLYGSHYCPSYLKKEDSFVVNGTEIGVYKRY